MDGKNMRHSQTFFNELRLMHLETELHNYQCSLSNNNKILKRFKPSKFANSKVRSYFQMSFTVAFFVFCLKRVIKQQIELLMRVSFLDKKNFQNNCTAGLCFNSARWHLASYRFAPAQQEILSFFIEIIPGVACESFRFFRLKFLVSSTENN